MPQAARTHEKTRARFKGVKCMNKFGIISILLFFGYQVTKMLKGSIWFSQAKGGEIEALFLKSLLLNSPMFIFLLVLVFYLVKNQYSKLGVGIVVTGCFCMFLFLGINGLHQPQFSLIAFFLLLCSALLLCETFNKLKNESAASGTDAQKDARPF